MSSWSGERRERWWWPTQSVKCLLWERLVGFLHPSPLLPTVKLTSVTIYYPSLSMNSLPIPVFSKHTETRYNFKRNFTENKGKTKSKGKENKELEQSHCRQCLCYCPAFGAWLPWSPLPTESPVSPPCLLSNSGIHLQLQDVFLESSPSRSWMAYPFQPWCSCRSASKTETSIFLGLSIGEGDFETISSWRRKGPDLRSKGIEDNEHLLNDMLPRCFTYII